MNDAANMRVEGFAQGRLIAPVSFQLRSAGPQDGQYDPRPRYPDGTLVNGGFVTKSNRGRPKGTGTGLGIGHSAEAKAEMVGRYKAGEGLRPLAAAYSTTAQRVREIVRQAGVEIRGAGYCRKVEPVEAEPILEPVMPVLPVEPKRKTRSEPMNNKLTPEQINEVLFLHGDKKPVREIAAQFGVLTSTIYYHIGRRKAATVEPPSPAMDDPTPGAAANDARVIQVHDLTVTAPRTYSPPAVVFDGLLVDLVRPGIVRPGNVMAVGQMVQAMVNELNTIPGVTAFFDFDYRLTAGVRP